MNLLLEMSQLVEASSNHSIDDGANIQEVYAPTIEELADLDSFLESAPEFKELKRGKVLRFLRARDFDKEKTTTMLKNHLEWSEKIKPLDVKIEDVEVKALESACWRYMGDSDDGSPILEVRVKLWNPHEYDIDAYEKYVVWFVTSCERMMKTHTKFIILFDMAGWGLWMAGYLRNILKLVDIAQNQYPERLRRVLLINAPYIFSGTWNLIKPWLDPKTAAKVAFVDGVSDDIKEELNSLAVKRCLLSTRYSGEMDDEKAERLPCSGFPFANVPDFNPLNKK